MKKRVFCSFLSVIFILILSACSSTNVSQTEKNISVTVIANDITEKIKITTLSDNLKGALDEISLIEGESQSAGFYVTSVMGITADESKEEWWCFTKANDPLFTGVKETKIADGESYEITLKQGF